MESYEGDEFRQPECTELMDKSFTDCEFYNCMVNEITVKDCSFRSCRFYNCTIMNIELKYSDMFNCEFYNCMSIGINWRDVANTHGVSMPFIKTSNCLLRYNIFTNMKLKAYHFDGCNLEGCYFEECNLEGASFMGCNLEGATFKKNMLKKADFREAISLRINILDNTLKDAKFSYSDAVSLLSEIGLILE